MTDEETNSAAGWLLTNLTRFYKILAFLMGVSLPLSAIGYLSSFVDPDLKFHSALFHEIAISCATFTVALVSFIGYHTYKKQGSPFLRFLTLAYLGFALIYAPHGVLTRAAPRNIIMFLVFGPASRFVMSVYLFIALLRFKSGPEVTTSRSRPVRWWPHVLSFIAVDLFLLTLSASGRLAPTHLRIIESSALVLFALSALLTLMLRPRTPMIWLYLFALLCFAEASLAFLLARPWNHMWWLAHAIFAAGIFVLGYGIVRASEATHSAG